MHAFDFSWSFSFVYAAAVTHLLSTAGEIDRAAISFRGRPKFLTAGAKSRLIDTRFAVAKS